MKAGTVRVLRVAAIAGVVAVPMAGCRKESPSEPSAAGGVAERTGAALDKAAETAAEAGTAVAGKAAEAASATAAAARDVAGQAAEKTGEAVGKAGAALERTGTDMRAPHEAATDE